MTSNRVGSIALCVALYAPAMAAAQDSQSAGNAAELAALMEARKISVVAAPDPAEPDRFVAAMLFPQVQMLVVSARYAAPELLREQITRREYADVYGALQQSSIQESRIFIQDLKNDGLHLKPGAAVDVMYERVVNQTIFDGNPARQKLTEAAYAQKFKSADALYSRMLVVLIQHLRGDVPTPER